MLKDSFNRELSTIGLLGGAGLHMATRSCEYRGNGKSPRKPIKL